jgi:hypothetical protein
MRMKVIIQLGVWSFKPGTEFFSRLPGRQKEEDKGINYAG